MIHPLFLNLCKIKTGRPGRIDPDGLFSLFTGFTLMIFSGAWGYGAHDHPYTLPRMAQIPVFRKIPARGTVRPR